MSIVTNEISNNSLLNTESKKKKNTDNCQELKNIAYKTMLLNGNNIMPEIKNMSNNEKVSYFLENESSANKKES